MQKLFDLSLLVINYYKIRFYYEPIYQSKANGEVDDPLLKRTEFTFTRWLQQGSDHLTLDLTRGVSFNTKPLN